MRRELGRTLLACAFIASVSTACGQADEATSEQKVYGGTKVPTGNWLSTVGLSQGGSLFCTGTAITPTLVISAAHCAQGVSASSLTVYVGEGKDGGNVRGQYKVKKVVKSPKYNGSKGNDISFLVLSTPLDLPEEAYVPVLTDPEEIAELHKVGSKAQIVGYGLRNGNGFGVKYEVTAQVVKSISSFLSFDAKNEIAIGGGGKDSCNGDSGGPVYGQLKSGEWRVYGVTSRGGSCGTGGIYGMMHANICWIQENSGENLNLPEGYCGTGSVVIGDNDNDEETPVVDNDDGGSWWNDIFGPGAS